MGAQLAGGTVGGGRWRFFFSLCLLFFAFEQARLLAEKSL